MDHIGKALEQAKQDGMSTRDWMAPKSGKQHVAQEVAPDSLSLDDLQSVEFDLEHLQHNQLLSTAGTDNQLVADQYRLLRTRAWQKMQPAGWHKLGITSATQGAGKTFTAINLAITLARATKDLVILLDADIRNPSIAKNLGIKIELGLTDYLTGQAQLRDIIYVPDKLPNLMVIPCRFEPDLFPQLEEAKGRRMQSLFAELDALWTMTNTVIDLPPVLLGDDVLSMADLIDAFLLVVRDGETPQDQLLAAADLLKNFPIIGTILNRSEDIPENNFGYGYSGYTA